MIRRTEKYATIVEDGATAVNRTKRLAKEGAGLGIRNA